MVTFQHVFSGFSVNDLAVANRFYGSTLGLAIQDNDGMGLELQLPDGASVFIYGKPDHTPATFTILNFVVDDIDAAVDELSQAGVEFVHYHSDQIPQDTKGIARGRAAGRGPDIAWFTDPSGNILSVLQN